MSLSYGYLANYGIVAVGVIKSVAKTDKGGAGKVTKVCFTLEF